MAKNAVLISAFLGVAASLAAEDVTLPAAASIVGGAPFFSDVRAFNTSYTGSLDVTAHYRCFIPTPCTAVATPTVTFALAPRESRSFNDIVVSQFGAPNTAGGVEFEFSGQSDQLVVTSRLYSTAPQPTVGMFIPGLRNSEAHPTTVLTSIRNGGAGPGFRTNVGIFNREDAAVSVTFTIFDAGAAVGTPVTQSVAGHSGVQVNRIFDAAGASTHSTDNAYIVVSATGEVFSYAAVIDNNTTDPIFVRGAEDQVGTSPGSGGGGGGGPLNHTVQVGQGGMVFLDASSQSGLSQIKVGDTVTWVWNDTSMNHSVASGNCTGGGGYYDTGGCNDDGLFSSGLHKAPFQFTHTFTSAGTFPYFCGVHGAAMKGRVVVTAPAAPKKQAKRASTAG